MEVMADNFIEKQIFPLEQKIPLPVIGSFINLLRKRREESSRYQNKQYTAYVKRIKTLYKPDNNDSSIRP
jgi:hypothetical protein